MKKFDRLLWHRESAPWIDDDGTVIDVPAMTLRDLFAAAALAGIAARDDSRLTIAEEVHFAFEYADAALEERLK